jgi:hypothetical protein
MDPLQYFDEEYNSLQTSISDISSLVLECRDILSSSMTIQKRFQELYNSGNLTISDMSPMLDTISSILDLSSNLLNSIDNIKNKILLNNKKVFDARTI